MIVNQVPVLLKAGEENVKSNSIIQFHYKGTMFVELLKVVCGTPGFRRTRFDWTVKTHLLSSGENGW
jgi:hypothetical protein